MNQIATVCSSSPSPSSPSSSPSSPSPSSSSSSSSTAANSVDLDSLPAHAPALCVTCVYRCTTETHVRNVFGRLNLGKVDSVEMIPKAHANGEAFFLVVVRLAAWASDANARRVRTLLLRGDSFRVIYKAPWFWKVVAYREPTSAVLLLQIGDEPAFAPTHVRDEPALVRAPNPVCNSDRNSNRNSDRNRLQIQVPSPSQVLPSNASPPAWRRRADLSPPRQSSHTVAKPQMQWSWQGDEHNPTPGSPQLQVGGAPAGRPPPPKGPAPASAPASAPRSPASFSFSPFENTIPKPYKYRFRASGAEWQEPPTTPPLLAWRQPYVIPPPSKEAAAAAAKPKAAKPAATKPAATKPAATKPATKPEVVVSEANFAHLLRSLSGFGLDSDSDEDDAEYEAVARRLAANMRKQQLLQLQQTQDARLLQANLI